MCIGSIFIFYKPIISLFNAINFEFTGYIGNGYLISSRNIILRLPILIYIIIFRKEVRGKYFDSCFYLIILALDFTFNNFSVSSPYAGRIACYFSAFYCFMYATSVENLRRSLSVKKQINIVFTLVYCASYFVYYILICNNNETLPYIFM